MNGNGHALKNGNGKAADHLRRAEGDLIESTDLALVLPEDWRELEDHLERSTAKLERKERRLGWLLPSLAK